MRDICLLESQACGSNVALKLWRFSREVLGNEANFVYSPLPCFLFSLSRLYDLEHLSLRHLLDFLNGHFPLSSLFFPNILTRVTFFVSACSWGLSSCLFAPYPTSMWEQHHPLRLKHWPLLPFLRGQSSTSSSWPSPWSAPY